MSPVSWEKAIEAREPDREYGFYVVRACLAMEKATESIESANRVRQVVIPLFTLPILISFYSHF